MAQKKLRRFADIKSFGNVFEYVDELKANWQSFFKNPNPIVLELACGKGEYTIGLARLYSDRNFIGVDIKGNRLWVGAKQAITERLPNVAFLRTQIEKITEHFSPGEVSEIWITFPDPQLQLSRAKKRLTHPRFLRAYQQILEDGGSINLKTDSPDLYQFTKTVIKLFELEVLADYDNVLSLASINEELKIKTHYEKLDIAKSNKIHYLRFKLNKPLPAEKEEHLKELTSEPEVS